MRFIHQLKRSLLQTKELSRVPAFEKLPEMVSAKSQFCELKEEIVRKHAVYIREVSSADMAISLELAIFLLSYCLWKQPKNLLDLGAGFSSYVFRLYREAVGNFVVVYSVDDHVEWMCKTQHYLESAGLNAEHIYLLSELQGQVLDGHFDLVLLDLNYVDVRRDYISYAGQLLSANGAVIVDDVHKVQFLREVKRVAAAEKLCLFNIKKTTVDEFGRFSILMKR